MALTTVKKTPCEVGEVRERSSSPGAIFAASIVRMLISANHPLEEK
jgi:hypothetical protein